MCLIALGYFYIHTYILLFLLIALGYFNKHTFFYFYPFWNVYSGGSEAYNHPSASPHHRGKIMGSSETPRTSIRSREV